MDTYGIIGWPVAHSLSPAMHNAAFKSLGIRAVYGLLPLAPENLAEGIKGIRALNIKGVSVTVPHKETVMPLLDEIDPVASEIGAVNTIVNKDGRLLGFNTDWIGVKKALEEKIAISGQKAVVVGAGGAAKAVVYALIKEGASVAIYNRTFEKAKRLAQTLGGVALPWEELASASGDILIQTTSVGLKEDKSPVPKEVLSRFKLVMDIVYQPLKTRLLREAEEAGCETIDGLSMLVYQGIEQFYLWFGARPQASLMREAAEKELLGEKNDQARN
ncbi:shikimate 5-dehydrogenase [Thermodesulfatator indicus DSM 15286]|uniref:Shikimate dehydrogenase (NADP(+)) n=1 Tax=Thermodesulfatator indicus (strain DSM 15286 / JCM 11887 / CIR29812) TaxID=667014 RepID=F8A9R4_THEID|nr:shikimate dehydrogenase [Thermodesulfatator indicus]AEH45776.1 shikimate 5-dehydrogenase [Thermodesulfatator indicus DSM 15286]